MSDNYNGKPYQNGFLQDLKVMPYETFAGMAERLGLKSPVGRLSAYRLHFIKNDFRYTIDEMYMADAFISSVQENSFPYMLGSFSTEEVRIREAFSDIMEKRRAVCDNTPVTLTSLTFDYNKYLRELGYCDGSEGKFILAPIGCRQAVASAGKYRTVKDFITHGGAQYAIAKKYKPSRFCTDAKRLIEGNYGNSELTALLVKLPDAPLMYEYFADTLNSLPAISNVITYLSPIGKKGLLPLIAELETGFNITMSQITSLFPEFDRPYMLSYPMSAVLILTPVSASADILSVLRANNFDCETIGSSSFSKDLISVNYAGFLHCLNTASAKKVNFVEPISVRAMSRDCEARAKTEDGISVNVFNGCGFDVIRDTLLASESELIEKNPDCRLASYICIPFCREKANDAFTSFLASYRALAEHAVPICELVTCNNSENDSFCVFIVDEAFRSGENAG